ncbi:hypothetical protein [Streptomyces phytophilus]|uniref:hypothetical protein n=1 Tax=Streptomyces phytophilus TaxID=722715 RepID=UPI0015F0BFB2|nr:hypothetical protein [Streptomyces phytophilus]
MNSDPRLFESYEQGGGGNSRITQFLAGAPAQLERYQNAPEHIKAIVDAAVDLRRMGHSPLIPRPLLTEMATLAMDDEVLARLSDDWIEEGIKYALAPCRGASGLLIRNHPMPGALSDSDRAYRVSDYLEQVGRKERSNMPPQPSFLFTVLRHVRDVEQLRSIATALEERGRCFYAAQLLLRASDLGDFESARMLAGLLEFAEDCIGAAQIMETNYLSGGPAGIEWLAYHLLRSGEQERAEALCVVEFEKNNTKPWIRMREAYDLADDTASSEKLVQRMVSRQYPEIGMMIGAGDLDEASKIAIRSIAERFTISEVEAKLLIDRELKVAAPRLKLITSALNEHTEVLRESMDRLKEYGKEFSESGKAQEVRAIREKIAAHTRAGDETQARSIIIQGLNSGIIGLEVLGSYFTDLGQEDTAESAQRHGIDWYGNLLPKWGLREVRNAYDSLSLDG